MEYEDSRKKLEGTIIYTRTVLDAKSRAKFLAHRSRPLWPFLWCEFVPLTEPLTTRPTHTYSSWHQSRLTTDRQTDKEKEREIQPISNCYWRPIAFVCNFPIQFHGVCSFIGYWFGREATANNILWNCHVVPDKLQAHGLAPKMFRSKMKFFSAVLGNSGWN